MAVALRRESGHQWFPLEKNLAGSVKKLKGSGNEFRLRVGGQRVLFAREGRTATIDAADIKGRSPPCFTILTAHQC